MLLCEESTTQLRKAMFEVNEITENKPKAEPPYPKIFDNRVRHIVAAAIVIVSLSLLNIVGTSLLFRA